MIATPKQTPHVSGSGWEWTAKSSTHASALLLFIAFTLIALPEISENSKSFLLAVFACVALLQSNYG